MDKHKSYYEKPKKYRWYDGHDRQLTAGGLLPYDEKGVWLVGEQDTGGSVGWTDMGGRYEFEDCDIYKTIAREVGEELYHSSELLRRDVVDFSKKYKPIYVNGHQGLPVYICYPVHTRELAKKDFILDPQLFQKNRRDALESNPSVPVNYYPTIELRYFSYCAINRALKKEKGSPILKFRIQRILKSFLQKMKNSGKNTRNNEHVVILSSKGRLCSDSASVKPKGMPDINKKHEKGGPRPSF